MGAVNIQGWQKSSPNIGYFPPSELAAATAPRYFSRFENSQNFKIIGASFEIKRF
jgi:hypothetical protein